MGANQEGREQIKKNLVPAQGHRNPRPVAGSLLQNWSLVRMRSLGGKLHVTQVRADGKTQGGFVGTSV